MPGLQFRLMLRLLFVVLFSCGFLLVQAQPPGRFDVLIQNGRVMDGSGATDRRSDVGIAGGVITAVRDLRGSSAARVIDAGGRLVTPGFIDVHSHAAEGLVRQPLPLPPYRHEREP